MKYSIVLHPVKMQEWGLNLTEATIFSFCYELPSWADTVIVDGVTMFRGNRRKASEEMGLELAPDTIYRTYKKLHDKGLIVYVKNGSDDLIALTDTGKTWGWDGKKSEHSEKNPSKLGKKSESHNIVYKDTNNNTPPAVGGAPTSQESHNPLKEEKKKKGAAAGGGADNEPKELATVFDLARKELLGVGGMDWKQAKEHKNLKELVAALGRKGPEGAVYDLPTKRRYLRKFLEIASADDFIKRNFTPSILYSMMNKIFTEHELKKQEAKKAEEMPYHQKFDHQTSSFSKELAAKKKI